MHRVQKEIRVILENRGHKGRKDYKDHKESQELRVIRAILVNLVLRAFKVKLAHKGLKD